MGLGQQTSVGIMSVLEEEEVAALRADLETMKREKEAAQAELARVQLEKEASDAENREHGMRFRRERSWGTSFDRKGGDNSAGRRGTAVPTMGPMWTRGVRTAADSEQSLTYVYRGIVPKLPVECSPSKYIAWEQRFEFFIANQGLRHTISLDAPEIAVISSTNNAYLFDQFGEELVLQHRQVWGYISDATVYAPFESSLYKCNSISDALRMMRKWHLPLYPAERHLLVAELERVQFMGDEESEIVQFILRQFPERPSHPHALVVGRGCRDGGAAGVGVQRRDNNMASRGGGMPQQQQQQQLQYWSRDGGIPHQHQRRSHAFTPARQARQPQPLQLPSRRIHTSGGDGEHGRNPLSPPATEAVPDSSVFPAVSSKAVAEAPMSSAGTASTPVPAAAPAIAARQARQPQPLQLPSRRIHTSGGDGEHGRNPLSPPATEAVPDSSVFPAVSSKAVAEAPMSSAGTASTPVPAAAPAIGGTVFPTTSVEGTARAPASDDGTVALKAASTTSGTVPSATPFKGAVGARESSSGAAPSDVAAEAFLLAVRYNNSSNSSNNSSSSSNSRSNSNSCSSNDTTSNHDSWWEATYVGALLRPFDPGKGCQRDARIGAILGVDLPFDRGKA